jgi:hypothetical protein
LLVKSGNVATLHPSELTALLRGRENVRMSVLTEIGATLMDEIKTMGPHE